MGVLKDAGFENGDLIGSVWSGSAMMNSWGQNMIRGQVVFTPLIREGLLPERLPFYNVEGGCATGSLAFHGAWRDIQAGIGPADIDCAEVHDATSFGEIYQAEMMQFCPIGEGGKFVESGETSLEGKIPINTSGGLIAKGHPIGATGLSMINELVTQIRGEAGERQVKNAEFALQENGGGVVGIEEAACSLIIFGKDR